MWFIHLAVTKNDRQMKKISLFVLLTLICITGIYAEDGNSQNQQNSSEIRIVVQQPNIPSPREIIPIICHCFHSYLQFTFLEDMDITTIHIINANTGAQVETSVPTNCSNVQVDISSLGQGDFTILIYAGDTIYTGSFTL